MWDSLALLFHLCEAIAAVDRSVRLGLEGNSRLAAAGSAGGYEILTRSAGSVLTSVTAGLAALGLILEAALGIEFLLASGENEFSAAFFALECLVLVHGVNLSLIFVPATKTSRANGGRGFSGHHIMLIGLFR